MLGSLCLQRTRKDHRCQSDEFGIVLEATVFKLLIDRVGAHMGFSERINNVLSSTELGLEHDTLYTLYIPETSPFSSPFVSNKVFFDFVL